MDWDFPNTVLEKVSTPVAEELLAFEEAYLREFQEDRAFLQPVLDHVGQLKGKRLRPVLFFLSQGLLAKPHVESVGVAVLLELLHTASLIHDDVVDGSSMRRGERTLNEVWGNRVSLLVGDYLFARVLSLGVQVRWREVMEIVSRVVLDMGRGELQPMLEKAGRWMTMEAYFRIIEQKTAGFIGASCELGGLVVNASSEERERLRRFGESFGVAFQIRDDILDVSGVVDEMGKPVGQDFSNGRVTLPLILALEGSSEDERKAVLKKLADPAESNGEWIREFVKKKDGIPKAQERAALFSDKTREVVETFLPSVYREALEKLVAYNLERGA